MQNQYHISVTITLPDKTVSTGFIIKNAKSEYDACVKLKGVIDKVYPLNTGYDVELVKPEIKIDDNDTLNFLRGIFRI
jgi:hypothetical protein